MIFGFRYLNNEGKYTYLYQNKWEWAIVLSEEQASFAILSDWKKPENDYIFACLNFFKNLCDFTCLIRFQMLLIIIIFQQYSMMKKSLAAVSYDHKNRLQFSDTCLSVLAYFYLREIIHLLLKYHSISHQDIRY